MSMGQWLCVPMVAAGVALWVWAQRQPVFNLHAVKPRVVRFPRLRVGELGRCPQALSVR